MTTAAHEMEEPGAKAPLKVKRPWGVHMIGDVVGSPDCAAGLPDGRWVRAVPRPYDGNRIQAAWWVLTGRAYALIWPSSEDLANALDPYQRVPKRSTQRVSGSSPPSKGETK